ncbi:MAG: metallopeptidase [Pirellulaceae bacterium]
MQLTSYAAYRDYTGFIALAFCFCLANFASAQNPSNFYDPVQRDIEGWSVSIDPQVLAEDNRDVGESCLTALANHLQRVKYIVAPEKVVELQQLRLWVDWEHSLGNMQYHPSRGWLLANDYDPRLAKHVHIPRATQLLDPRQWAKHPYAVLHELAHAYHDQKIGFDYQPIKDAHEKMKQNGSYERVLSHTGKKVRHYALSNHKEYFAESTEAYFGVNDFFPFVRAELKHHDPSVYEVMESVWGKID